MRRRPVRLLRAAAGGAGLAIAALALGGCTATPAPSTTSRAATATASPAPTVTTTTTTTTTVTSSPSASASGSTVAGCATAHLALSLHAQGAAAGSSYEDVWFTNTGSSPCTLQGWPGVSFIDGAGKQIGAAAKQDRSSDATHDTVTIVPNGHAVARLQIAEAGNYPSAACDPTTTTRLKVYPPGSYSALTVTSSSTLQACRSSGPTLLSVQPLHASS